MTSIQDVVNASYRIRISASEMQHYTESCADNLRKGAQQLSNVVRGSRTGENAVREVSVAERKVRESALAMLELQSNIDHFIEDLTK